MGGGGAMRAAAKVAGVVNGNLRGVPAVPQAEHPVTAAARKASRPVSAIVSSSEDVKPGVLISSQNGKADAALQRPSWEIDDWEFAGGEEEKILGSVDPMPRLVFGGVPTLKEAKAATSELKDALEKVYLSSPNSAGSGGSFTVGQEGSLPLLSNSEYLETKNCLTSETTATSMPKHAIQAFKFLSESPAAQNVVASIASDQNVWNAVMQNEALTEFLESQKSNADFKDQALTEILESQKIDAELQDQEYPNKFEDSSDSSKSGQSGNSFVGFLQKIKLTVVEMVSNLSGLVQNLFGVPAAENISVDADGTARATFWDKAQAASPFMGLAVLVIMVVVLKRG